MWYSLGEDSLWFGGQNVCRAGGGVSPGSPSAPGKGAGQGGCSLVTAGLCKSRSISGRRRVLAWLQATNWREMDFCRERMQPCSCVCTWAERRSSASREEPRGPRGELPPCLCNSETPKLREEDEGQSDLVFGELKRLSANRGLLLLTVALGPSVHVKWFGDTWGG